MTTENQPRSGDILSTSRKHPLHYEKALFLYSLLGLFLASRIFSISCITSYFASNRSIPLEPQDAVIIEPWCTNNQTDVICHYRKTIHNRPINFLPSASDDHITNNYEGTVMAVKVDATRKQAVHLFTATRSFNAGLRDRLHRDYRLLSGSAASILDDHHAASSTYSHSLSSFPWMKRQQRIPASTPSTYKALQASSLYSKPTFLSTSLHEAHVMVRTAVSIDEHTHFSIHLPTSMTQLTLT